MDSRLRQRIRDRAGDRCEYCRLPQAAIKAVLQVEHIVARQHTGSSLEDNLALACDRCNLYKGTNLSAIDPDSGEVVPLFNPRADNWKEHFLLLGAEIIGITPTGRATLRLLRFNAERRFELRRRLIAEGHW
jgi:5-methylcytosine-specific restriction endonuclease McrA